MAKKMKSFAKMKRNLKVLPESEKTLGTPDKSMCNTDNKELIKKIKKHLKDEKNKNK